MGAFLPRALWASQPAWGRVRLVGGLVKDEEQGPGLRRPEGALVPSKTQDALGNGSPLAGQRADRPAAFPGGDTDSPCQALPLPSLSRSWDQPVPLLLQAPVSAQSQPHAACWPCRLDLRVAAVSRVLPERRPRVAVFPLLTLSYSVGIRC